MNVIIGSTPFPTDQPPVKNEVKKPTTSSTPEPTHPLDPDSEKYSMMSSFTIHTLLFGVSSLFERCLATLRGLQTFEHGTAITSYVSIITCGTNPAYGGSGAAVSPAVSYNDQKHFKKNCKGKFHVVLDENLRERVRAIEGIGAICSLFITSTKVLTAKMFSGFAGSSKFKRLPVVCHLIGIIHFIFCPLLRFHYTKEESDKIFVDDPDTPGIGGTTDQALPTHRIGLLGVVKHGSFSGLGSRFYNQPMMMTACVVGLFVGAALTAVGLGFVI